MVMRYRHLPPRTNTLAVMEPGSTNTCSRVGGPPPPIGSAPPFPHMVLGGGLGVGLGLSESVGEYVWTVFGAILEIFQFQIKSPSQKHQICSKNRPLYQPPKTPISVIPKLFLNHKNFNSKNIRSPTFWATQPMSRTSKSN